MTKKTWVKPEIEVLDVKLTMAGPGLKNPDSVQPDVDEVIHYS
ncbi:paeninodin family lasso peptide [Sporolactobacillus shoreicorticis]|uniref:Paeninodin family lasso peptide n=1 Tax=Sporolactobacillus shoreicorticis TaxID=1923877 RepID=A0ABW5S4H2_9BACL|nr:paeninodin family lasso peptide [Sporolactobacillus shoreicorticis]MCO7124218.1 paeninodin family lasso peptide [Sporolactobacillus shoreicorticis]